MTETKIKSGDDIICVHRSAIVDGHPTKGKIIVITDRLNRQIGVQLEEKIRNGHDCDGHGQDGYCLWCRPWHVLLPAEWEEKQKEISAAKKAKNISKELPELVLRGK